MKTPIPTTASLVGYVYHPLVHIGTRVGRFVTLKRSPGACRYRNVTPNCPDPIIRATLTAVHRRDHAHGTDCCHPHVVEVVHLGPMAMTVCHDCSYEFGFDDTHSCERVASEHRMSTA